MPLWTTYLANLSTNKATLLKFIEANSTQRGMIIKFVMRNRGNNAVAPTEVLLKQYKAGQTSWAAYTLAYEGLLCSDEAYDWMTEAYNECFSTPAENVVLVCFEKSPERCHRRLLAERIKKLFPEIDYRGELPNNFSVTEKSHGGKV
jgi:uncharacterized protein YeaO (DUF488 family)